MTTSYTNRPPPINTVVSSSFDKAAYRTYETVKSERDALKESDKYYKRRIETLEAENRELLKSYQGLYDENKLLITKLENGPDAQRIRGFREEIKRLEEKVEKLQSQNHLYENELQATKKEYNTSIEDKKRVHEAMKIERQLNTDKMDKIEKENKEKAEQNEKLDKQIQEYEMRIKNYEEESEGLLNRYKDIKAENIKLETKFKKQKNLLEDELRETKLNNTDMAKEIIMLKSKLTKLESEYNSVKIDLEAASKQVEYQAKEIEIFQTEKLKLQRNISSSHRQRDIIENELRSYESFVKDMRKNGTEAIVEERQHFRRREEKLLKRVEDLELQLEELSHENKNLSDESKYHRMKMESAMLEKEDLLMAETSIKRRLQVLEQANIDLDRQTRFKYPRSLPSGRPKETRVEQDLTDNVQKLEDENWRLRKKIKRYENEDSEKAGYQETTRNFSRKPKDLRTTVGILRAEMPSLTNTTDGTSYLRRSKTPRNLPPLSKK